MQFQDFKKFAAKGTLVAMYRQISADSLTPVTAFLRLRKGDDPAFLFESVEGGERIGRYSFLGRDPFQTVSARGGRVTIARGDEGVEERDGNFFDVLEECLEPYQSAQVPGLPPLTGGAVGYIGYDAIRYIEAIPDRHDRDTDLPDAEMRFYDTLVGFDHATHRIYLIANAHVEPGFGDAALEASYQFACGRLDELEAALSRPAAGETHIRSLDPLPPGPRIDEGMESNFLREDFEAAVSKAREYIYAGDIFQVVLSQRFQKKVDVDPFEVYRCLRALNPSPYLFFVQRPDTAILGSSPEIMVRVEDGLAMVRPIAGTRRRGRDAEEDVALEADLLGDAKELAEHRMLVDLGRNDIGRVAEFGSIELSRLEIVERYSHVMHIVSQVDGKLRKGTSAIDAFRAGFPAGTVSGAPKIRAMEIIDDLERSRRGIYAGAVGYIDFAGNLDTCIAIRTLQFYKGVATAQAGAGIVADSVPENEYLETIHKASALFEAIRRVELEAESLVDQASDDSGSTGKDSVGKGDDR